MSKSFKDLFSIDTCYKSNKLFNHKNESDMSFKNYEEAIYMDDQDNYTYYSPRSNNSPPKSINKKTIITKLQLSKNLLNQCTQKDVICEEGNDKNKCLECYKNKMKVIIFPCEHKFCWKCTNNMLKASEYEKCIFCSEKIEQAIKIKK